MELREFVAETLGAIIGGVSDAQRKAQEHGGLINPLGLTRTPRNVSENALWDSATNNYAQVVSFDVAITAKDSEQGGARVRVLSGILGGELGGGKGSENTVASRVQFTVPVLLPGQDIDKPSARPTPRGREIISDGVRG